MIGSLIKLRACLEFVLQISLQTPDRKAIWRPKKIAYNSAWRLIIINTNKAREAKIPIPINNPNEASKANSIWIIAINVQDNLCFWSM